ncbi:hypothetical protein F2Q70_00021073 [Brassica cretica]|uniref:Uncharacterized protein n=1 Tax=Brassica cretica TaxID=69181 RepID=A0A8S9GPV0_BRACR|nr:hypothetical protein F2Q70_00021073 [Brassica cretica]
MFLNRAWNAPSESSSSSSSGKSFFSCASKDPISMKPEQPSGRGRGGGCGGHERGCYSGPPPYYEAQQDGGDYGYNNAPPPQYHEYYDGGFNRSNGPPIQAAA